MSNGGRRELPRQHFSPLLSWELSWGGVVGQDVTLPCPVTSTEPLDIIEVQWVKIIAWKTESLHKYTKVAGDWPGEKYQGRTVLLRDGFAIGNVSLLLKSVQPADDGKYSCIVISSRGTRDVTTTLSVAGGNFRARVCDQGG
uniref:Ig-like domain-containing protein n=1 Tax=Calidris pygmaea TaxID=425635 RepID=A0A8C3KGS9_9CHAR